MSFLHRIHLPPSPAAAAPEQADAEVDLRELIARNLVKLRSQRGLSLLELSALSHISYWTLQEAELARELPSIEVLWKLGRTLGVSCDAFVASAEGERAPQQ